MARKAGFHGDRRGLAVFSTLVATGVAFALFLISFEGLSYVGHLIGLGDGAWLVPVALDAAIVVATLLAIIRRAQRRGASLEWAIVYASTAASASANFVSHAQRDQGLLPAVVAASAPVLLLLLSHAIIRTLVESEPTPARAPRASKRAVAAAEAIPAPAVATVAVAAPKPAPRRTAPRPATTSLDDLTGEGAELYEEFRVLVRDPETSMPGLASERLSDLVYRLVEHHGARIADLARAADHPNPTRLQARIKKTRAALVSA